MPPQNAVGRSGLDDESRQSYALARENRSRHSGQRRRCEAVEFAFSRLLSAIWQTEFVLIILLGKYERSASTCPRNGKRDRAKV